MGADGGTNADTAGRDRQAPPAAAAARARVAAADLVDVEAAIFAELREEMSAASVEKLCVIRSRHINQSSESSQEVPVPFAKKSSIRFYRYSSMYSVPR